MSPRDSPAFTFIRLTHDMKPGCFSYIGPEVQIQVLMLTRPSLDQLSCLPSTLPSLLYVMGSLDLSFCYQTSSYTSLAEMTRCGIYIIWKLKTGQQWWAGFRGACYSRMIPSPEKTEDICIFLQQDWTYSFITVIQILWLELPYHALSLLPPIL